MLQEVWKRAADTNIIFDMDVIVWNYNKLEKLEVGHNRVLRTTLNTATEGSRGDMGWREICRDKARLD